ncbi:M23 family metallopeptidase [Humidesulfovibrio idahonensis]
MTRRFFFRAPGDSAPRISVLSLALVCLLLALCPAQAAQAARHRAKGAGVSTTGAEISGARLLCPQRAGIGEPFLVRLVLARPVAKAELTFMGRSTPLALRNAVPGKEKGQERGQAHGQGAGQEAAVLLGADILDARPGRQTVVVRLTTKADADGAGKTATLRASVELVRVKHPVERLDLDPAMVNPPESELPRIARERAQVRAVLARVSDERLWSLPFARPVQPGELSSEYGLGRVLNGQPRSPHRGLDLEAKTGDAVSAAADGVVALAGHFYYAGNCVYLDHGQGLFTMYFHMSELRVGQGDRVARGQLLGLAGDTGRSTRAHLHFGASALGRLVDPAPLFLYDAFHNARNTPPE